MSSEKLINGAPYLSAIGGGLVLISMYVSASAGRVLAFAGLTVSLLLLGALLSHIPSKRA